MGNDPLNPFKFTTVDAGGGQQQRQGLDSVVPGQMDIQDTDVQLPMVPELMTGQSDDDMVMAILECGCLQPRHRQYVKMSRKQAAAQGLKIKS